MLLKKDGMIEKIHKIINERLDWKEEMDRMKNDEQFAEYEIETQEHYIQ